MPALLCAAMYAFYVLAAMGVILFLFMLLGEAMPCPVLSLALFTALGLSL